MGDDLGKRRKTARQICKQLERLGVHKVYVPDFGDGSGKRTALGCYFAASFSKLLGEEAKNVEVLDRVQAHKYLGRQTRSDNDLSDPAVVSNFVSEFGLSGMLIGMASTDQRSFKIELTVRDSTGKDLFSSKYVEQIEPSVIANIPFEGELPSGEFHFAGLDGVTTPKCTRCSNPPAGRVPGTSGKIVLSVLVTTEGELTASS